MEGQNQNELTTLALEIKAALKEGKDAQKTALQCYKAAGEKLTTAKAIHLRAGVGQGWRKWCADHAGITYKQAEKYILLAANWSKFQGKELLSLRQALQFIHDEADKNLKAEDEAGKDKGKQDPEPEPPPTEKKKRTPKRKEGERQLHPHLKNGVWEVSAHVADGKVAITIPTDFQDLTLVLTQDQFNLLIAKLTAPEEQKEPGLLVKLS